MTTAIVTATVVIGQRRSWSELAERQLAARRRKRKVAGPQDDIDERHDIAGVSGEREMEARLALNSVAQAIGDLAADQRDVLLLVCVEELSYKEAAEVLA
ncbi:MAG: hypothetical protein E5Y60_31045, partial [Mesorhizobium sp.]